MDKIDINALFSISYGMFIVTTMEDNKPVGCAINVCSQVTSEPIKIAVCLNKKSYTCHAIDKSGTAAIAVLSKNASSMLIGGFGYRSSADCDKFANISYDIIDGLPVLNENGVMCNILGKVDKTIDLDSHLMFIILVQSAKSTEQSEPMTYQYFRDEIKDKKPNNKPTHAAK